MTARQQPRQLPLPHAHRWRIAEPNGATSTGICACGEMREFPNAEPTYDKGRLHSAQVGKTHKRRRAA